MLRDGLPEGYVAEGDDPAVEFGHEQGLPLAVERSPHRQDTSFPPHPA